MKFRAVVFGMTIISSIGMASAQEYDLTPDFVPQERSDFERALETPPPEPYVPNALEALEQGKIPTSENPLPPADGFGVTIKDGAPQGTYTTDF